jgi:heptosyltransferase-2
MRETLIVRLPNWLGDTVMAVPALRSLRAARGDARVVLVGPWATLLAGQELADVLVPYARSWAARLAKWDEVRAFGAAAVVLLPNSFEAAVAARYWNAPRRIGLDAGGRGRLLTDAIPMPSPREHQIDEYARVMECLGPEIIDRIPRLAPPPEDSSERATIRRLLQEAGIAEQGHLLVGIHLGAAYGPSKLWPSERIARLCRILFARGEIPVLLGARENIDVAGRLAEETGARSLVGRDSPELLTALLAELSALVCGDTGVGHLAAALGTPVVALFGPTDPGLSAPRGRVRTERGPSHSTPPTAQAGLAAPVTVITHPVACAPCFYRTCPIDHPCLRGIDADEVRDALDGLTALAVADHAGVGAP